MIDEPFSASLMQAPFTMASCPWMFRLKAPLGHFQTLLLSAAHEAKVYSVGWTARARMLFLWFVRVTEHFPAAKSHNLTILSIEPLINCGSDACDSIAHTAFVCPPKTCTAILVRMSQILTEESRPPVARMFNVGCSFTQ